MLVSENVSHPSMSRNSHTDGRPRPHVLVLSSRPRIISRRIAITRVARALWVIAPTNNPRAIIHRPVAVAKAGAALRRLAPPSRGPGPPSRMGDVGNKPQSNALRAHPRGEATAVEPQSKRRRPRGWSLRSRAIPHCREIHKHMGDPVHMSLSSPAGHGSSLGG